MSDPRDVTREPSMIEFERHAPVESGGARRWWARAQNFSVEWIAADRDGAEVQFDSAHESLVLVFGHAAQLSHRAGTAVQAAPRSVCIVPAGKVAVRMAAGGTCAVLASQRADLDAGACLNAAAFAQHDARITPSTPAFQRLRTAGSVQVFEIDSFDAPPSNPRLKMLQSETLSINGVDYDGPRDRRALSPHSHADLEQGSLAVAGHFVHHLRQPWGRNADAWRDDAHVEVGSPSLMVVPVNLIHTSEGVREGHHLLIDVFSPPRRDFIAKGWVHNAADYREPLA